MTRDVTTACPGNGARVGRAGTIQITADTGGTVWVGGAGTGCIRGTITL
jgi:predicted PhzF superfamily epimerase YddE/YHI9